eukprot:13606006-Alexandrium_andersonii.AAC.1
MYRAEASRLLRSWPNQRSADLHERCACLLREVPSNTLELRRALLATGGDIIERPLEHLVLGAS